MTASTAVAGRPAALVWFRNDLRLADHEPLHAAATQQEQGGHAPLLLPWFCLDERELAPRAGETEGLGVPQLGPHRLRLVLEACASLRAALRARGSDLLWVQGSPEAAVGQLVALAAAAGCSSVTLHHHVQPGAAATEDAVATALAAAARQHGLASGVRPCWGCTLYHPDDLPWHLWQAGGPPERGADAGEDAREAGRHHGWQQRFASLPHVMSDFRRATQSHAPVRPPLPPPREPGEDDSSGGGSTGWTLPQLPPAAAAAAAEAGLLGAVPTDLAAVYATAGPAAAVALARWEALAGLRCSDLAPACSGVHDARSAVPFAAGEDQAVQRLRYYLGLEGGGAAAAAAAAAARSAPIAGYRESRQLATGVDASAKLSPFLALGCLSPRVAYAEVARLAELEAQLEVQQQQQGQQQEQCQQQGQQQQQQAGAEGPEGSVVPAWLEPGPDDTWRWLLMHLTIRDFFIFNALKHGQALERPGGLAGGPSPWRRDPALMRRWCRGATGLPFVDAAMAELAATGYTSNRARQNVASFLAKGLGLDWGLGARWFEACLCDHDWALNLGNWAYNAGAGNDPRDRSFRTVTQGERYDAEAQLIRAWLPPLRALRPARLAHRPWEAPKEALEAAGLRLVRDQQEGEEQEAGGQEGAWYPLPVVDPATQIGKGPKRGPRAAAQRPRKQQPAVR